ncbi:hypothetical protein [Actinomadura flavalba]|uniref:hypothetical protein n=1 Tax=Actinomadura flavalba TaxID=1120938 RepID=UPI00035D08FE|nr:hypothetical protein [Actinomadura flavalba]
MRPVVVEVLPLRGTGGDVAFRRRAGLLRDREDPDAAARRLVPGVTPATLLHSTSWRTDGDRLVLTYAVAPDPQPWHAAVPLRGTRLAHGPRPDRPSPEAPTHAEVAAHAARHLAFLLTRDEQARAALAADTALTAALAACSPEPAGRVPA